MRGWMLTIAVLALVGCSGRYHPDNFKEAAVHGAALKSLSSDCRDCHGADLTGGSSNVGCDGCHAGATPTAWRTNCTFCHGGVDNNTGAPPRNLDGTNHVGAFPSHTAHVTGSAFANAYDCTECHVKAKDVLSAGHIFGNPPGGALNDFGAGVSPQATFDRTTGTCANVYCHGNGRGDNGTMAANAPPVQCSGCHAVAASAANALAGMSGPHASHMADPSGITCADCHGATTTDGATIANKDLHINGKADIMIPTAGFTYDATAGTCTGVCHGVGHSAFTWTGTGGTYHPPGYADGSVHGPDMELQRQDCRTCHGADLAGGNGANGSLVGPSCDGCHSGATATAWRSNCTFCHGGGNGDTRGMPPRDPGSTNTSVSQKFIAHAKHVSPTIMSANDCTTCHRMPADVLSAGHAFNTFDMQPNVILTLDGRNPQGTYDGAGTCASLYCHGNGQAGKTGSATDGGPPMTCTSCHGGQANNRSGLTGEHRSDHGGIACYRCHNTTVGTDSTSIVDVTKHINGTRDVVFSAGGSYDPNTKTCTNVGCHGTHSWNGG